MELPDYPETSEQQQREDTTQAAMSTSADTAEEQDDSDDVIVLDEVILSFYLFLYCNILNNDFLENHNADCKDMYHCISSILIYYP